MEVSREFPLPKETSTELIEHDTWSERCTEKESLTAAWIEPWFVGRLVRSLVNTPTERNKKQTNSLAWVRRLSAKLVPTFVDRGPSRSQHNGSLRPYSRISRPEPLLFLPSSSLIVLTRPSGPRYRLSYRWKSRVKFVKATILVINFLIGLYWIRMKELRPLSPWSPVGTPSSESPGREAAQRHVPYRGILGIRVQHTFARACWYHCSEVPGLSLSPKTGYPDSIFTVILSHSTQEPV
jgi:hypothetical protein